MQGKLDLSAHSSPLMVSVGAAGALSKFALAGAVNVNMMRAPPRRASRTAPSRARRPASGQAVRVNASDASALYAITVAGAVATEGAAVAWPWPSTSWAAIPPSTATC